MQISHINTRPTDGAPDIAEKEQRRKGRGTSFRGGNPGSPSGEKEARTEGAREDKNLGLYKSRARKRNLTLGGVKSLVHK